MRYQGGSQEIHSASNGIKTHLKTSKRSDNCAENVKAMHRQSQATPLKRKGTMTSLGGSSNNINGYHDHDCVEPLKVNRSKENQKQSLEYRIPGGDLLSQWRQKKRSRGCRAMGDDSARKSAANDMHATTSVDHNTSTHPDASILHANVNTPLIRRSSEDLPACGSNVHSLNLRIYRHSPESSDRPNKIAPCTNGDVRDCIVPNSSSPSENEAFARAAEKMNMDEFSWPRILISLSRKEKEDDFFIIKGSKLPQRPKKRPKIVERNLQNCYPGFWLSDVARGRYDVREKKSSRKKPRGLKAMESTGSDSDRT